MMRHSASKTRVKALIASLALGPRKSGLHYCVTTLRAAPVLQLEPSNMDIAAGV